MQGNMVDLDQRAEAAKEYLEKQHWGHRTIEKSEEEETRTNKLKDSILKIIKDEKDKFPGAVFKTGPLSLEKMKTIRNKSSRGKHLAQII